MYYAIAYKALHNMNNWCAQNDVVPGKEVHALLPSIEGSLSKIAFTQKRKTNNFL